MEDYILVYDDMEVIRLSDQNYPMYMPQIRAQTPQTGFPIPIRDYILEMYGYALVHEVDKPVGDVLIEGKPELKGDGKWYKTWQTREFTEEEKSQNLMIAKEQLVFQSENVLATDIQGGIEYQIGDKLLLVEVLPDKLTTLLCIKSLARESEGTEEFEYSFMDGTVLLLSKDEFLSMWSSVMRNFYNLNKKYWAFRSLVNSTEVISDLPGLPVTFKGD